VSRGELTGEWTRRDYEEDEGSESTRDEAKVGKEGRSEEERERRGVT